MLRVLFNKTLGKCRNTNTPFYCTAQLTKEGTKETEKCRYEFLCRRCNLVTSCEV